MVAGRSFRVQPLAVHFTKVNYLWRLSHYMAKQCGNASRENKRVFLFLSRFSSTSHPHKLSRLTSFIIAVSVLLCHKANQNHDVVRFHTWKKKIIKLAENLKNPVSILHTQIRNKIAYLNEKISNQELILKELLVDPWKLEHWKVSALGMMLDKQ